jgi:hypothetical protein
MQLHQHLGFKVGIKLVQIKTEVDRGAQAQFTWSIKISPVSCLLDY